MKVAAIGIGSNSVRMLVAQVQSGRGRRIRRDRAGTRLFAGLDERRMLSRESMESTVAAVAVMARSAREEGAAEVSLFATSATRDAANSAELAAMLRAAAGVELEICSGEEEAALSFLGATDCGHTGVIDIGGGSTEVIVGTGLDVEHSFSCQMGAVRLFRLLPIACEDDLAAVERMAEDILMKQLACHPGLSAPDRWIGTGGTFTTLAAMTRGISWSDRRFIHGTALTMEDVRRQARLLAGMTLEERLRLPGLQPNRADIAAHGFCILLACMRRLGIARIDVSEYGNLDGYIKRRYQLLQGLE